MKTETIRTNNEIIVTSSFSLDEIFNSPDFRVTFINKFIDQVTKDLAINLQDEILTLIPQEKLVELIQARLVDKYLEEFFKHYQIGANK